MSARRFVDIWPFARANMTPDERAEVYRFAESHFGVHVVMGWNRRGGYFAYVGGHREAGGTRAIDAFRKAAATYRAASAVQLDTLLAGGPAA